MTISNDPVTQTVVHDVNVNSHTGYITVHVKTTTTQENSTWSGPVRGYGVDASIFASQFNSDLPTLMAWVASQHKIYTGVHTSLVDGLTALKGQVIG